MSCQRRAFTLIEMLITIALIMLLASLVVVTLRGVTQGASRAKSTNALRQMAFAYTGYSTDNKQHLMPGYLSSARVGQLGINAKLANGVPLIPTGTVPDPIEPSDVSSYVWRLAPYLDHAWKTLYADYRSKDLVSRLDIEFRGGVYGPGTADVAAIPYPQMGIGLIPSFGLNCVYLGGDDVHGGADVTARNPWDNPGDKLAATRYSEVKNPARIVLFATTAHWGEGDQGGCLFPGDVGLTDVIFGYVELRPPFIEGVQHWEIIKNTVAPEPSLFAATDGHGRLIGGGVPVSRWGTDMVPSAHLDGSVTTEDRNRLSKDMSLWLPEGAGFRPE